MADGSRTGPAFVSRERQISPATLVSFIEAPGTPLPKPDRRSRTLIFVGMCGHGEFESDVFVNPCFCWCTGAIFGTPGPPD